MADGIVDDTGKAPRAPRMVDERRSRALHEQAAFAADVDAVLAELRTMLIAKNPGVRRLRPQSGPHHNEG